MRIRPSARLALATATLAIVAAATPALGHQTLSSKGSIGSYSYSDQVNATGATCSYDLAVPGAQGNDLDRITVNRPFVFAKAGTRTVGWRFIVQRSRKVGGSGGWTNVHVSGFQKRTATPTTPAAFTARSYLIQTNKAYHFRTIVVIRWYKPGSTTRVAGSVRLRTEYYRSFYGDSSVVQMGRCLPEY
ncbi:MAG: hypothetical protein KF809_07895 [Chloroflexi bacterium]|nr:hypothetical protein [Chloroflexota bacterium]